MRTENFEPSMSQIDDYEGPGSEETRRGVRWTIISGLVIGVIYALARIYFWDMGVNEITQHPATDIRRY